MVVSTGHAHLGTLTGVRLFLAFVIVPLVEMYLLIRIGSSIGALATIGVIVLTGLAGASLARLEGWRTLRSIEEALAEGVLPAEEMVDGVLIFAAGLLLITPGFLTDGIGFCLLVPRARRAVKRWLRRRLDARLARGDVRVVVTRLDDF